MERRAYSPVVKHGSPSTRLFETLLSEWHLRQMKRSLTPRATSLSSTSDKDEITIGLEDISLILFEMEHHLNQSSKILWFQPHVVVYEYIYNKHTHIYIYSLLKYEYTKKYIYIYLYAYMYICKQFYCYIHHKLPPNLPSLPVFHTKAPLAFTEF